MVVPLDRFSFFSTAKQACDFKMMPSSKILRWFALSVEPVEVMSTITCAVPAAGAPIVYANHHINYLAKYLHNPLFVAYAYNGGIGFTKRLIKRNDYFRKGPYEPYLSMEKIKNVEAREYGKKVLVNYVIYQNKLGIPARITPYIQDLTTPSETDSFRKQ